MGFMEKIFGDINTKEVKKIEKTADQVMALDSQMAAMSDEELKGKTAEFKERLAAGETLDDILVEAFAVCREAAARSVGMKHFKVRHSPSSGKNCRDEDRRRQDLSGNTAGIP